MCGRINHWPKGQGSQSQERDNEPSVEYRAIGPAGKSGRVGGDEPKSKAPASPWPNKGFLGILVERESHP